MTLLHLATAAAAAAGADGAAVIVQTVMFSELELVPSDYKQCYTLCLN